MHDAEDLAVERISSNMIYNPFGPELYANAPSRRKMQTVTEVLVLLWYSTIS